MSKARSSLASKNGSGSKAEVTLFGSFYAIFCLLVSYLLKDSRQK